MLCIPVLSVDLSVGRLVSSFVRSIIPYNTFDENIFMWFSSITTKIVSGNNQNIEKKLDTNQHIFKGQFCVFDGAVIHMTFAYNIQYNTNILHWLHSIWQKKKRNRNKRFFNWSWRDYYAKLSHCSIHCLTQVTLKKNTKLIRTIFTCKKQQRKKNQNYVI